MITLLRRFFLILLVILFLLVVGIFLLVTTETGTRFALNTVARLGVPLTFQDVHGNLASSLTLINASYKSASLNVTLGELSVKWHPLDLLRKKLLVDNLTLRHVAIIIPSQKQPAQKKSSAFHLPVDVQVNQLDLQDIAITTGNPQQPIRLSSVTGKVTVGEILDIDINAGLLTPLALTTHFNVTGKLKDYQWQLQLNNALSAWKLLGSGNQHAIAFTTRESKLLGGQLSGSANVQWSPYLSWDVAIKADTVNLSAISGGLPQNLSLVANSKGNTQAFNLSMTGLQGKLKNFPLAGYLKLNSQLKTTNPPTVPAEGFLGYLQRMNINLDTQMQLGNANVNMQGSLAERWDLKFKLYVDDLHKLTTQLAGSVKLQGTLSGYAAQPQLNANISLRQLKKPSQPDTVFQADVAVMSQLTSSSQVCSLFNPDYTHCAISLLIKLTHGQITYPVSDKKITFPVMGALDMLYDPAGLNSRLELLLYGKKTVSLQLLLPKYKLIFPMPPTQPVTGQLAVHVEQSQLAAVLPTDIHAINSLLTANVQLAGTVNQPKLHGAIVIKSDSIAIPKVAIKLLNLHADIGLDNEVINYSGSVKSGTGNLQLKGKSLLTNHGLNSTIAITGTQFQVSNTPKMQITASPQLHILSDEQGWRITGNVLIPSVNFKHDDINQALALPPETVIVEADGKVKQAHSLPINADITLELGDKVQIDASGLTGRVIGKLQLISGAQGMVGTGTLNIVDASYNLQGETLAIAPGNIIFSNSAIDNPQLDIRASKKINYKSQDQIFSQQDNLTVGVAIKGTVNNPKITLFSDPSGWSQADILSLILLGQPASQASGSQVQLLARAAQALTSKNGVGVSSVTRQVQRMFGLSELSLNSELNNQAGTYSQGTSLVVGKSLSPRLSLSYSLNVFNSINTLRIRYLLSKHWFIQSESNTLGNGMDLIYTLGKK